MNKICFKCQIELPLELFYKHSQMKDGHLNKCIKCTKTDVRIHYRNNVEKISNYDKERGLKQERKEAKAGYYRTYRKKNFQKYKARSILNQAVRDGKLIRQPCVKCQNEKSEGHHEDYSKPLEVIWVCQRCHRKEHHPDIYSVIS